MTHSNEKRNLTLLMGAASILVLAAVSSPAFAQSTPEAAPVDAADDTVVIVKGQRGSAISAVNRKKKATEIVDSIVAVDIGKLPDLNVAEALQRISGVQISRNRGEGSAIAIRGLTQVRTELNGRDSFSTTNGRSLSFEDVPAELLGGVDIYKNPSAKQIEGGVGGLVNLRTRMPFDSKGQVLSASVSSTYYDMREKAGAGASVLYSDRWDTGAGEVGFLANLSYTKGVFREDAISVEPFYNRTDIPGSIGTVRAVASGGGISAWSGDRTRTGGALALQWRPSEDLQFYATVLHSQYEFYEAQTGIFGYGAGEGGSLTPIPGSYSFDSDGNLLKGGFVSPYPQTFTRDTHRQSYTTDYAVGFLWNVSNKLKLTGDAQFIQSGTRLDDVFALASYNGSYNFFMDLTGEIPSFTTDTPNFYTTKSTYAYSGIIDQNANNSGHEAAVRADLEWDFDEGSAFTSFTAGIRATSKDIRTAQSGFAWNSAIATANGADMPEYAVLDPHQENYWRGDATSSLFGPYLVISPELLTDHAKTLKVLANAGRSPQNQMNVQGEDTTAAYVQLNFDVENFPLPFDGNVGIRYVSTDVSAVGSQTLTYRTAADPATPVTAQSPITVDQKYNHVLPSLNVRFHISDDLFWRVAASRALSRPSFDQLAANFTLTENYLGTTFRDRTGSGGNPGLKPLTADQLDTSLEWYYAQGNLAYITVFDKQLQNFVQNGVYTYDFAVPGKGVQSFLVSAPTNGDKGTIKGFEAGVQHFFTNLPAPFDGLGIQANYTYVDSKAPSPSATDTAGNPLIVPLEGLSKDSYNLVGLYEKGPLSVRLAYNWRSAWVVTTSGNGTGNLPIYHDETGQLDGTVSYDFSENWGVSLDFVNLLNTVQKTYQAYPNRPRDFVMNDRRFGVRLRASY